MADRLMSVRRVADVQAKLRRIAELRLVDLRRQEEALRAEEAELVRFLSVEGPLAGVLSTNISRRLKAADQRLKEISMAIAAQERKVKECAARVKLSERMIEVLDLERLRNDEKRDLDELIEGFLARSDASLR